jgi:hypothetical protein
MLGTFRSTQTKAAYSKTSQGKKLGQESRVRLIVKQS